MNAKMTPLLEGQMYFAYVSGIAFILVGIYLSYRQRRVHPLLLLSISALSFSWIESSVRLGDVCTISAGVCRGCRRGGR